MVKWDDEVDVVCTGSGAAGLASAIAVTELGGSVFLAEAADGQGTVRGPWLGAGVSDAETNEYFAALSADLGPLRRSSYDLGVPVRAVHQHSSVDSGRTVAPFVGAKLRDWTARCLSTPYGYLSTRIPDWHSGTVHTTDGDIVEVADIGTMTPDGDDVARSILAWLGQQARDRGIEANPDTALDRIVFEEGVATGAVFTTADGPLAIRARHTVTVTSATPVHEGAVPVRWPADAVARVCLTGQRASRFGRLEVLTSEPLTAPVSPTCAVSDRRLWVSLRDTQEKSHLWRCGKVHGHPPAGQ